MALFLEDSAKVTQKQIPIPQNAKKVFKAMEKVYEPYLDKVEGGHVLKSLASDKHYNKKGKNADKINGEEKNLDTINVDDAKVRIHRMNKFSPNSVQYQMYGGELGKNIMKQGIERARGVNNVDAVKPPKPTSNAEVKPATVKTKEISTPNGKISYTVTTENKKLNEIYDERPIAFDYIEDYDAYYVLGEFFSSPQGTQDWGVLINPEMYAKALRELSRFGKLTNSTFPSKYVYQWMGIIMKNTAILEANTDLAGHSMGFPGDIVADYAERIDGIEIDESYEEGSEWLDKKGLYDWMKMPDGSDAWSDFGLEPLWDIIKEYREGLSPEKVLVLVNRALDIGHMRGDLASIFIHGGSKVLSKISEDIKRNNKKVYITEKQIISLHGEHSK